MSDLSPSRISDIEVLNLIISDPQSMLDGKFPHPAKLVQIDTFGLSTLRDGADDAEFEHTLDELRARARASGVGRFFHGVCRFEARIIRYSGGERFLCAYDTALPSKPNHADICGPDVKDVAEAHISNSERKRRNYERLKKFVDAIGDCFVEAAAFRDGKFAKYCRGSGDAIVPSG